MALPRVLFFQDFRFFKFFPTRFLKNFISFGHFCILRNKMLCPEDRRPLPGGAVHFHPPPPAPPPGPPPRGGGRTNFRDLDPVWERERERVNRDALTRLKTPEGSADFKVFGRFSGFGLVFRGQEGGSVQISGIWIPSGRGKGRG